MVVIVEFEKIDWGTEIYVDLDTPNPSWYTQEDYLADNVCGTLRLFEDDPEKFVKYPSFRSSTKKYDPCVVDENALKCFDCKVQIISDRFLGEEFMRKVMRGRFNYPYVLIADTAGCNMRCWFCYSWHFWTPSLALDQGCKPSFASVEKLADQFHCKFK